MCLLFTFIISFLSRVQVSGSVVVAFGVIQFQFIHMHICARTCANGKTIEKCGIVESKKNLKKKMLDLQKIKRQKPFQFCMLPFPTSFIIDWTIWVLSTNKCDFAMRNGMGSARFLLWYISIGGEKKKNGHSEIDARAKCKNAKCLFSMLFCAKIETSKSCITSLTAITYLYVSYP